LTGCEAAEPILDGDRLMGVVDGAGEEHRAGSTLLACGAWSGAAEWLPEQARPPVRPVKGQLLVLRDSSGRAPCERILVSERVYLVPREDGRLVVGATVEEMGFDATVTAGGVHELLREAYRLLPEVAELELLSTDAGLRPGTADNAPIVGRGELDGLVVATGHYRHGILLAPLTSRLVAEELGAGARVEAVTR
jgi:glycine oxidase